MSTFIQNNVQFSADNSALKTAGKKLTKFGNINNDDFSEEILSAIGGIQPFVNAVEIDWNNAQLGTGLIRPIGELRCSRVVPMGYRRFAII